MPLFEVLYYPFFEPTELWLRRYLLVFDKVWTIVPNDAHFKPSRGVALIADAIPNSFETVAPTDYDKTPEHLDIYRLEKAFKLISDAKRKPVNKNGIVINISKHDGRFEIVGYTLLHPDKLTNFVLSLLEKYGLVNRSAKDIVSRFNRDAADYLIVDADAADLIVSHIADRVARRQAFHTITDQEMPYLISSLPSVKERARSQYVRSMLSRIILKFEIPQELVDLTEQQYKELRDSYSDIRETFHGVVMNINNLYNLDYISDSDTMRAKIREVTRDFHLEISRHRKSAVGKNIKRWVPLGVGSLATIVGAAATQSPEVALTGTGISVIMTFIQHLLQSKETETEKEQLQRMLSSLRKDIIVKSRVKKLL